ncbi:MAG: phosphate ABC transporter permease subunit PstC [Acidimicrobiales bacterium]
MTVLTPPSALAAGVPPPEGSGETEPRPAPPPRALTSGDRVFRNLAVACGASVLLVMALIAVFLSVTAWPAISDVGFRFLTDTGWTPDGPSGRFGVAAVLMGTIEVAGIALALATPVAIGTALFINEVAPVKLRRPLTSLVDLLAALPSLIYGIWGLFFLQPRLRGLANWLTDNLSFIPFFRTDGTEQFGGSLFVAGLIVGMMILPIATSITREVMAQVPRDQCEAAYALGGTRREMIRTVLLPFARSGIIGGSMLALGRALGETIAVVLILSHEFRLSVRVLQTGGETVASLIAVNFNSAAERGQQALAGAGLALFVLTLVVNMGARAIVARSATQKGLSL